MQVFHHTSSDHNISKLQNISAEDILLFDIETTGLSPELSTLFMIGCGYYAEHKLHTIHWLADDFTLQSEQAILLAFFEWMHKHFDSTRNVSLVTYNGDSFDLPFLKKRLEECHLHHLADQTSIFDHSIDYYRQIYNHKHLWPIKNLKLLTVASWLGYQHSKTPSGRALIKTYHAYIKEKDPALLNLLFLHNIDDIEALSKLLSIELFKQLTNGSYSIRSLQYASNGKELIFHIIPNESLPTGFSFERYDFRLNIDEEITLTVPVYSRGLRYYYHDFKNYIYLLSEDHALHKSMSAYIDKSNWIKATRESCYTWFTPDENFFDNTSKQIDYIQMVFRLFDFI